MSDTQLRIYAFEQARAVLGAASLPELLEQASAIYEFLMGSDPQPTKH